MSKFWSYETRQMTEVDFLNWDINSKDDWSWLNLKRSTSVFLNWDLKSKSQLQSFFWKVEQRNCWSYFKILVVWNSTNDWSWLFELRSHFKKSTSIITRLEENKKISFPLSYPDATAAAGAATAVELTLWLLC